MLDQTVIQVRVDTKLKQEATEIFKEIGMDMPTAIRMFLKKTVANHGFPFEVMTSETVQPKTSNLSNMVYKPATPCKTVTMEEFIDLIMQVPKGKLTRFCDIYDYLQRKYQIRIEIDFLPIYEMQGELIPFWRIISTRGMLEDFGKRYPKEVKGEILESEGFELIPAGAGHRSRQIKDYKMYLFDFEKN